MGENFAEFKHIESKSQDNAPLFVSLYIVLLAFFIMLNTIATPRDDKTEDILDSVKMAFAYDKPLNLVDARATKDTSGSAMAQFTDALEQHAKAFLPIDSTELSMAGDAVQLTIKNTALYTTTDNNIQPQAKLLLTHLARSMNDWYEGYEAHLEIITNTPPVSIIEFYQGGSDAEPIKRAAMIGRFMSGLALKPQQIVVGLRTSDANTTLLRFTIHKTDNATTK